MQFRVIDRSTCLQGHNFGKVASPECLNIRPYVVGVSLGGMYDLATVLSAFVKTVPT